MRSASLIYIQSDSRGILDARMPRPAEIVEGSWGGSAGGIGVTNSWKFAVAPQRLAGSA